MTKKPVALIILDGFGLAAPGPGNAVHLADTPNFDRYWSCWPRTQLQASGRAVGLPEGQMGNSEVGHMNLGAGRVVMQSLTYIQSLIESGEFYESPVFNGLLGGLGKGQALHLMGLVSRGGVHSDLEHVFALLELARRRQVAPVYIHVFTDGRDTPPESGLGFVGELQERIEQLGHDIRIATVSGRYYAMDRDKRWDRVKKAYDAIVDGASDKTASDPRQAIRAAYERGETDEFILPTVILDPPGQPVARMRDGDGIIFFNFRADRARQMTYALMSGPEWNEFQRCRCVRDLHYASMMEYDEHFQQPFAFALPELDQTISQVVSQAGKRQYHSAETEKYPHVTYFFNALMEEAYPGEERRLIPSPKVATYDLQPQMSAPELTRATVARLREQDDDFVLINFANPDMVGHTGVLQAAIEACQAADEGLGQVVEAILARGGAAIILADHGNAEVMVEGDGSPHTAHTTNPVPCILVGAEADLHLRDGGRLGDVAPTLLELMGLEQPKVMTGQSLLQPHPAHLGG